MLHIAHIDLPHELPATTTRWKYFSVAQNRDDPPNALFAMRYHGSDCAVLGAESDATTGINTDSQIKITLICDKSAADIANCAAMCDLTRINNRLGLLD